MRHFPSIRSQMSNKTRVYYVYQKATINIHTFFNACPTAAAYSINLRLKDLFDRFARVSLHIGGKVEPNKSHQRLFYEY